MGSCQSAPIDNHGLVTKTIRRRAESSFCAVHYGHDCPVPFGLKVVRNGDATDQVQELRMDTNFDCYCFASNTSLTLRKQGEDVTIAQIGNSGAVLGRRGENNALFPLLLSLNLKPFPPLPQPENAEVVLPRKAPPRVTVPYISLGRITDEDEFVVLATGGVWEVLSKEEVVTIVGTCPRRSDAAGAVVDATVRAWMHYYPTSEVDDCVVVCLFLRN
ncbi:putative protein phosphatase 2C 18 [Salvia divinorum]|uniref:PPM-type phosphatase domain-containing protein n=1 Tax=Salvia divinorum TaxID=28513 RepID=A0ABD1GEL3_SALDI